MTRPRHRGKSNPKLTIAQTLGSAYVFFAKRGYNGRCGKLYQVVYRFGITVSLLYLSPPADAASRGSISTLQTKKTVDAIRDSFWRTDPRINSCTEWVPVDTLWSSPPFGVIGERDSPETQQYRFPTVIQDFQILINTRPLSTFTAYVPRFSQTGGRSASPVR